MIKKYLCFLTLFLLNSQAFSQTVGTYIHKGKNYLVFPYRIGDKEEIPMIGYKIPDGEYIAFTVFNFRPSFSFKKKKRYHLTDTTVVAAIFRVKDNMAEGPAVFYSHYTNDKGKERKKVFMQSEGILTHNLKTGVWSNAKPGKKPVEYTTYKNGLKHGYHSLYNSNGQPHIKEKYCEGEACDTVMFFANGKLDLAYDRPVSAYGKDESCYGKGMELLNVVPEHVNTFYHIYDKTGLIYEFKYKDGKILPYDSIGIEYMDGIASVTVKDEGNGKKRLRYVSDFLSEKTVNVEYYDTLLYRAVHLHQSYKVRRKLFGKPRKKRMNLISSYGSEEEFVNPSTIIDSSNVPVLAEKEKYNRVITERYYIPNYQFAFEKNSYNSLASIDTSRKIIFLNQQTYHKNTGPYHIRYETACIPQVQQMLFMFQTGPYLKKGFIVCDERPDFIDYYRRYEVRLRDLETIPYYAFNRNNTYYRNDTLLNGGYYFSPVARQKRWPADLHYVKQNGFFTEPHTGSFHVRGSRTDEGMSKGVFVNGKKEGVWLIARASSYPKKTPVDPKAYFLSHPKHCYDLREISYKNGMKDGPSTEYSYYNPKSDDDNCKEPSYLYKEKECSYTRDTLNGPYKEYYHNKQVEKDLHFVMGSPDGEYKEYSQNGDLYKITHFNKGNLEGPYMSYREGKLSCYANFKNNRLVDSLVYYSDGARGIAVYLKNDTLLKRICYYPDGKIKELVTFSDRSTYMITDESISEDNYIEVIKASGEETMRDIQGSFRNYYDNGQLLSEGEIRNGELYGPWKFHAINGIVIHEVNFCDTAVRLPNETDPTDIAGFYKGYYTTGAKRCTGYIKDLELSYDCFTKQDKAQLDFYAVDFFDINGRQLLKNGNGYYINYDANGLRVSAGKLVNCREDSLWKYYTPEQKLEETGNYVNHKKDGVWYEGSLEGINFEDGACFDMNNTEAVKAFESERKKLSISRIIYKNGVRIETVEFYSDLNKTYQEQLVFPY